MKLDETVALITGGASGLGAATARRIAAAGGRVLLIDLNDELGEALAAQLGPRAAYSHANVREPGEVEAAIRVAVERFGRLNVAVNCAGIGGAKRLLGKEGPVGLDWFTRIIDVNLVGTFNVIRLAAAAMATGPPPDAGGERGVIINTASIAAFDGQIGQAAYAASKGGIVAMTLPIARDLARHAIRVATIAPGIFDTPLLGRLPDEARDALSASVPFPARLGQPEEYAHLACHIIENGYLNGEVIRLDAALRMAPR